VPEKLLVAADEGDRMRSGEFVSVFSLGPLFLLIGETRATSAGRWKEDMSGRKDGAKLASFFDPPTSQWWAGQPH